MITVRHSKYNPRVPSPQTQSTTAARACGIRGFGGGHRLRSQHPQVQG